MAFLDNLVNFLKRNGIALLFGAVVLGVLGYFTWAYVYGRWPFPPPSPGPVHSSAKKSLAARHDDTGKQAHLAPFTDDSDDFQYLDLSSAVVVPVTNPTNDVQSFTKHVDEYGQVTWEPNVMMDPIDILGEEEYDRAIDAARPTVGEQQLKRLTTPRYLQEGSMWWGTPWPEGGPGACNVRGCPTREDVVHKGVYAQNIDHGTWGAGSCTF